MKFYSKDNNNELQNTTASSTTLEHSLRNILEQIPIHNYSKNLHQLQSCYKPFWKVTREKYSSMNTCTHTHTHTHTHIVAILAITNFGFKEVFVTSDSGVSYIPEVFSQSRQPATAAGCSGSGESSHQIRESAWVCTHCESILNWSEEGNNHFMSWKYIKTTKKQTENWQNHEKSVFSTPNILSDEGEVNNDIKMNVPIYF